MLVALWKCYSKTFAPLYNGFEWRLDAPEEREIRCMCVFSSRSSSNAGSGLNHVDMQCSPTAVICSSFSRSMCSMVFCRYLVTYATPRCSSMMNSSPDILPATVGDRMVLPQQFLLLKGIERLAQVRGCSREKRNAFRTCRVLPRQNHCLHRPNLPSRRLRCRRHQAAPQPCPCLNRGWRSHFCGKWAWKIVEPYLDCSGNECLIRPIEWQCSRQEQSVRRPKLWKRRLIFCKLCIVIDM